MIKIDIDNKYFDDICEQLNIALQLKGNIYIDVSYVDKDTIRGINMDTRSINSATDVLSFPSIHDVDISRVFDYSNYPYEYYDSIDSIHIGSIIICEDIAVQQAEQYGHSADREHAYLFLHGALHLLGFDHMDIIDKAKMRDMEELVLRACDLARE